MLSQPTNSVRVGAPYLLVPTAHRRCSVSIHWLSVWIKRWRWWVREEQWLTGSGTSPWAGIAARTSLLWKAKDIVQNFRGFWMCDCYLGFRLPYFTSTLTITSSLLDSGNTHLTVLNSWRRKTQEARSPAKGLLWKFMYEFIGEINWIWGKKIMRILFKHENSLIWK